MSIGIIYDPCEKCVRRGTEYCSFCRLTLAENAYKGLSEDVHELEALCNICAHEENMNLMECDCSCASCEAECPCRKCNDGSEWKWRGECSK